MPGSPDAAQSTAEHPLPAFSQAALDERFGARHSWRVCPGQVWRANGGGIALLVLVLAVGTTEVQVAPLTLDAGFEDQHCLVVGAGSTAFTGEAVIWTDLLTQLPLLALDRPVDEVSRAILGAVQSGTGVEGSARWGRPADPDGIDDEYRAELSDELEELVAATRVQTDQVDDVPQQFQPDSQQLTTIMDSTGLDLPTVLAIGDGKAEMPLEHSETFRAVLGFVPRARPLPDQLILEVTHPANRAVVLFRAGAPTLPATEAAKSVAREVFALAARQTGSAPDPDWGQRLRRWAEVHHVSGELR